MEAIAGHACVNFAALRKPGGASSVYFISAKWWLPKIVREHIHLKCFGGGIACPSMLPIPITPMVWILSAIQSCSLRSPTFSAHAE
jgi:hypothetical protein